MMLTVVGVAIGTLGAGSWSIDHAIGIFDPPGTEGLVLSAGAGAAGAVGLLVGFWRPSSTDRAN